jgi:hypothetical protein
VNERPKYSLTCAPPMASNRHPNRTLRAEKPSHWA